jgi:hypothetical protein
MVEEFGGVPEATQGITRGVARLFVDLGCGVLAELSLATGRRVDVMAIDKSGTIHIIEVKASVADFRGDSKWPEYLEFCDHFHFAIWPEFPQELLPDDPACGVIVADRYGAEIVRPADERRLPAARRKAVTLRFARAASMRLHSVLDPRA